MIEVTPTDTERASEAFEEARLRVLVEAIREDGFVVIEDVVDHAHLDFLTERMEQDLVAIRKLPRVPHNFVWGNVQQHPPPFEPFVFRDVVANPFVCQVTSAVLGEGAFMNGMTGNTNLPGSSIQPVHTDDGQLWPDLEVATPAYELVVNIALEDTTLENGAIELWPGTHLDVGQVVGQDIRVPEEAVERRREVVPAARGTTRKGSVLIRDKRMWHRGMPNTSDRIRFMVAMVHHVRWLDRKPRYALERGCAAVFEGCPIEATMPFVDDPGDEYLKLPRPYAYDGPN